MHGLNALSVLCSATVHVPKKLVIDYDTMTVTHTFVSTCLHPPSCVFTVGRIGRWPPLLDFSNNFSDGPPLWEEIFREKTKGYLGAQSQYTFFVSPRNPRNATAPTHAHISRDQLCHGWYPTSVTQLFVSGESVFHLPGFKVL